MSNNRSPFWKDLIGLCTGAICCRFKLLAVQGTLYVVMHYYRSSKATFFLPCWLAKADRFKDSVVFPAPPLRLLMMIVFMGGHPVQ